MRVFIAVPLPEDCQRMLNQLQHPLRSLGADVRWTSVHNIHLTLKFLGEMAPEIVPELAERLRAVTGPQKSFPLRLRGLGAFPDLRSPRVIWCGIEGDLETLRILQKQVEAACLAAGLPAEERSFSPHVTLGRVRGKRNLHRLSEHIGIGSNLESCFAVGQVIIYQSTTTPKGPIYKELVELGLSSGQSGL